METIEFIILQIFFATRSGLKIGEYSRMFPSFRSRDAFIKSRASENIWWIIYHDMHAAGSKDLLTFSGIEGFFVFLGFFLYLCPNWVDAIFNVLQL